MPEKLIRKWRDVLEHCLLLLSFFPKVHLEGKKHTQYKVKPKYTEYTAIRK